jgi:uncharacterized membrane protein
MGTGRLEAFSDGVIAVIITIMVLEIKIPHGSDFAALEPTVPVFLCYVLSFIYVGIYWNNHHHMLQAAKHVDGKIMWANLLLLFWLSLIPATTGWVGENPYAPLPTALYGVVLLMSSIAYWLLQTAIISRDGQRSELARAVSLDLKGKLSPVAYTLGIAFAWIEHWVSVALYVGTALVWLIPDPRIEREVVRAEEVENGDAG